MCIRDREITIPLLIFCIVGYGLLNRQPVYEEFVEGAKDGFWTVDVYKRQVILMTAAFTHRVWDIAWSFP